MAQATYSDSKVLTDLDTGIYADNVPILSMQFACHVATAGFITVLNVNVPSGKQLCYYIIHARVNTTSATNTEARIYKNDTLIDSIAASGTGLQTSKGKFDVKEGDNIKIDAYADTSAGNSASAGGTICLA